MIPNLPGRFHARIGKPFYVCETPQHEVGDADLVEATARIRRKATELTYGPGGVAEWMGPQARGRA